MEFYHTRPHLKLTWYQDTSTPAKVTFDTDFCSWGGGGGCGKREEGEGDVDLQTPNEKLGGGVREEGGEGDVDLQTPNEKLGGWGAGRGRKERAMLTCRHPMGNSFHIFATSLQFIKRNQYGHNLHLSFLLPPMVAYYPPPFGNKIQTRKWQIKEITKS